VKYLEKPYLKYIMKKAVVLGAGGFIGGHLVTKLKSLGYFVRGVDIKWHEFKCSDADEFIVADLRKPSSVDMVIDNTIDEVYQLAADMGGAEYVFSGLNDADIMHNSAMINLNVCDVCHRKGVKKVFYSSSACVYPERNQHDSNSPNCAEDTIYPANPDSEYGWEKIFSERLYLSYCRNKNLDVKIARFHNIFGPQGTWCGGREKAPAAICRKVAMAKNNDTVDVFGDGEQTRSFLYVSECIDGILKLMASDSHGPLNIGSDEMVSINTLVDYVSEIACKTIYKHHIDGPLGVRGRTSDNQLIEQTLGWRPTTSLRDGLEKTYNWINEQVLRVRPRKENTIVS
jgi:GDP-D-mannose 3', 5'-epimerase